MPLFTHATAPVGKVPLVVQDTLKLSVANGYVPVTPKTKLKPERRKEYIYTVSEATRAAWTIAGAFVVALTIFVLTGVVTLSSSPRADADFADLSDDAVCLRAGRRADMTVVYLDVGSPLQRLKLLLDLGTVTESHNGHASLNIFSTRMHKSLSMACHDLDPPRDFAQLCHDLVLVAPNGSTSDQTLVHTTFVYQNSQAAYAEADPAALAGLDGTFRLTLDQTYWLTTTHLCFAPKQSLPAEETPSALDVLVVDGALTTSQVDLLAYDEHLAFDARCNDALRNAPVFLFEASAVNEASVWLSLSGTFLYEYGSAILDKRRAVVEAGENCSAVLEELAHQRDIYHTDCGGLALGRCHMDASVPFRRLSDRRMRIDLHADGSGTLISEPATSLRNVKQSYANALTSAIVRLLVLVLTAAVVFVRGSQNATSSRWLLTNVIDALHCRNAFSDDITPQNAISTYDQFDKWVDALISIAAWTSRLVVLAFAATTLVDDRQGAVIGFQALGIACSFVQFCLRYGLILRDEREAPITTLGGPMSVIDVTGAVLILFSDAPLLGTNVDNFASIGRFLIGLLISLAVCTRICFSAAMVSTMAVSATNGNRKDLKCHQLTLWIATLTWMLQGVATAGTLALLFVNPAALSLARSQTGDTRVIKYAIFLGLVCTSLPTFTKVSLRVLQQECKQD